MGLGLPRFNPAPHLTSHQMLDPDVRPLRNTVRQWPGPVTDFDEVRTLLLALGRSRSRARTPTPNPERRPQPDGYGLPTYRRRYLPRCPSPQQHIQNLITPGPAGPPAEKCNSLLRRVTVPYTPPGNFGSLRGVIRHSLGGPVSVVSGPLQPVASLTPVRVAR